MKKRLLTLMILIGLLLSVTGSALAETYYFQIPQSTIHAFWNDDGTLSLDYTWVFINDSTDPIEYIDLSIPNNNFDTSSIYADINGQPINFISKSEYYSTEPGATGVALGLESRSIPFQKSGTAHAFVGVVRNVIYPDDNDENYVSAVFSPAWFDKSVVHGTTDMTVIFHLPPGVQSEEPRWHQAPAGFPSEPKTGFDSDGRITYTWQNTNANSYSKYDFGASFPKQYVPESAVVRFSFFDAIIGMIGAGIAALSNCCIPLLFTGGIAGIVGLSMYSDRKRRMKYLPPKVSIEGHGIKRGLTAIEAAVLMEQPVDTVLTMVLFSLIKKNAVEVIKRDPLDVKVLEPLPDGLREYEKDFITAFDEKGAARRKAMQKTMVDLIRSVSNKMKGFSRKETVDYYKSITQKAWAQVEAAGTPEVRSEKFDEVMEWTMLDRDFNDRTRDVFRNQPVFVPVWWGRFDPGFGRRSTPTAPSSGTPQLGRVPGSEFAASMVTGIEGFAGNVIGNVTDFTNRITNVTNPMPKTSSGGRSHSGGGGGCACACACAGCACACAGGGR